MNNLEDGASIEANRNHHLKDEKKRSFPYFSTIFILTGISIAAWSFLKFYYTIFSSNKDYYANYFYHWRINYADKIMTTETYKTIPENAYSKRLHKSMAEYVEMAQGSGKNNENKGLLNMKFPEHFPRGHMYYHTHSNEIHFGFNKKFLEFRKDVINAITRGNVYEENKKNKNIKIRNFKVDEGVRFRASQILNKPQHKDVKDFGVELHKLLKYLNTNKKKYTNSGDISDEFFEHAKKVVSTTKSGKNKDFKINKESLKKFIERNGTVTPTIYDTFFYSRGFYMFFLSTLDSKLDGVDKEEDRIRVVARLYAKIATNAFQKNLDSTDKAGLGFFERKFGKDTSTKYTDKKTSSKMSNSMRYDDKNIKTLIRDFGDNLKASQSSEEDEAD